MLLTQPERIEILLSCGETRKLLHNLALFEPRRAAWWTDDGVKMHPNISGSPLSLLVVVAFWLFEMENKWKNAMLVQLTNFSDWYEQ